MARFTPIGWSGCGQDKNFVRALTEDRTKMGAAGMFDPDASTVDLGLGLKQPM